MNGMSSNNSGCCTWFFWLWRFFRRRLNLCGCRYGTSCGRWRGGRCLFGSGFVRLRTRRRGILGFGVRSGGNAGWVGLGAGAALFA